MGFLIPLDWLFGGSWLSIGLAQIVVAAATACLVYAIARRLFGDGVSYHFQFLELARADAAVRRLAGWSHAFRPAPGDDTLLWSLFPGYQLQQEEVDLLWGPYLAGIVDAVRQIRAVVPDYEGAPSLSAREAAFELLRRLAGPSRSALGRLRAALSGGAGRG